MLVAPPCFLASDSGRFSSTTSAQALLAQQLLLELPDFCRKNNLQLIPPEDAMPKQLFESPVFAGLLEAPARNLYPQTPTSFPPTLRSAVPTGTNTELESVVALECLFGFFKLVSPTPHRIALGKDNDFYGPTLFCQLSLLLI